MPVKSVSTSWQLSAGLGVWEVGVLKPLYGSFPRAVSDMFTVCQDHSHAQGEGT